MIDYLKQNYGVLSYSMRLTSSLVTCAPPNRDGQRSRNPWWGSHFCDWRHHREAYSVLLSRNATKLNRIFYILVVMDITSFILSHRERALLIGDYGTYKTQLSRQLVTLRKRLGRSTPKKSKFTVKPITVDDYKSNNEYD
jgi:hypothetical protein